MFAIGGMPVPAHALDLGELSVESGPGEPLRLLIEVNSVSASEAETLDVSLAGRPDYADAGVEYPALAGTMDFELVPLDQGNYQVVITTREAVNDASLRLLVAATWAGGREVREYTASLGASPSGAPAATSVSVGSVENGGENPSEPAGEDTRPVAVPGEEFLVQSGHTLSHIVLWMNVPEDLHRFRAYLAVLRGNPRAFINNNMNLVRSGAVLRLPTFDEIRTVSYSESVAAYSEQLDQFTAYQQRVRQRRADPDPAPEPQIADTVTEPEVTEPQPIPPAVPEEEPLPVEAPVAEAVDEPEPEEAAPAEVRVQEPDLDQISEPVEALPEIPEIEVTEEPAPTAGESPEARLTISQRVDPEAAPAGDDDQALLDALDSQLAQLDESLLASGAEQQKVQENLQQIQEQAESISTLIEVESVPLAVAQDRATDAPDEVSEPPASAQAGDVAGPSTEAPPEPLVDSASRDEVAAATEELPVEAPETGAESGAAPDADEILLAQQDTQAPAGDDPPVSVPEPRPALVKPEEESLVGEVTRDEMGAESGEVSVMTTEADAKPDAAAGTDEILLAQQDTQASAEDDPLVSVPETGPAPMEPGEEPLVGEVSRDEEEAEADEVSVVSTEADAEPDAAAGTEALLLALQDTPSPAVDDPLVSVPETGLAPVQPEGEPAGMTALQPVDGTAGLMTGESPEPLVDGVSGDAVEADEVSVVSTEADVQPGTATGTEEILLAQQDTPSPAGDDPLVSVPETGPAPVEPEGEPAGVTAQPAVDGTAGPLAVESPELPAGDLTPDEVVVETAEDPVDQAVTQEMLAEVSETDAESGAATDADEILLAQQETPAPAGDEPLVSMQGTDPTPVEPEEESLVSVPDPDVEEPTGVTAQPAVDGTAEPPAGESPEPLVDGVTPEEVVVETVEIPADQAATPEMPAEVSETDAEPGAATATDEILLAQQDTPAPAGEDSLVAVPDTGVGEPADAVQAEPASAVSAEEKDPAPGATRDGLLDWIKNVFAILPDYGPKIAVGLLAILAGLFVWQRRKARRMSGTGESDPSSEVASGEPGAPRSVHDDSGDAAPGRVAGAGMPGEPEPGPGGSSGGAGEGGGPGAVDPIVEADVYLEYDRIEQAIEVLKDAYAEDPGRGELAEKLLEIYHMQDDRWAFDALVDELRGRADQHRDANWDRIIAMGREVSPNNPLYASEASLLTEPASGPERGDIDPGDGPDGEDVPDHADTGPQENDSEPDEAVGDESSDGPDVPGADAEPEEGGVAMEPPGPGEQAGAAPRSFSGEGPPVQESDGEPPNPEEADDESDTALELARAYMDLGEREIARGYLEEVLKAGSEDQQEQARGLIRELDG